MHVCRAPSSQAWLPPIAGSSGAGEGGDKGGGGAGGGEGGRDKERQLLGTSDGEILLLEVGCAPPGN